MKIATEYFRERCEEGLWYFFVFLLPWQTVWILRETFVSGEKWQYGTISLYVSEGVLFFWIMFVLLGKQEKTPREKLISKSERELYRTGALFLFWIFLSVFWAEDRALAFSYFGVMALGVGLFWGIRKCAIDFRKTVFILLLSLFFHSGIAIGQFIFQESPGITILGMSQHNPEEAGTSVLKGEFKGEPTRMLRAYGGMTHPNILGGASAVGVLLALWLWVNARSMRENIFAPIFVFSGLLTLLLTFSRTAWLGFFLGFFVFFGWLFARKKSWRRRSIPICILVIFVVISFATIFRSEVITRFEEKAIALEGSVSDRNQLARDVSVVWKEHPLRGVGIGNSALAMMKKDFGEEALQKDVPVWEYQPAHNIFLLVLAELGVVGIILLIGCMVQFIWLGLSSLGKKDSRGVALLASLIVLIPVLFLDHWLWTSHFGILLFFFLTGMFLKLKKDIRKQKMSLENVPRQ